MTNSIYTPLSPDNRINALIVGQQWGDSVGYGISLSYSIPQGAAYWINNYAGNEPDSWSALDDTQASAFRQALGAWSDVANINFTEVADSQSYGDIRVAFSQAVTDAAGWAYVPGLGEEAGDLWLNRFSGGTYQVGSFGYTTFLHEIGHALGLAHPFEVKENNNALLVAHEDSSQYSLMSYNDFDGVGDTFTSTDNNNFLWYPSQATGPMLYDILAIQYLYGQNLNTRTGDDIYTFSNSNVEFKAIWDADGEDTFDLSNQTFSVEVDLSEGAFSSIGIKETWDDNLGIITSPATKNISIAYDVVIENVIGGSGDDILIGNASNNRISGGAGNDYLIGGLGDDTALYQGKRADYQLFMEGDKLIVDSFSFEGQDSLSGIEWLEFQDQTISTLLYNNIKPQTSDDVILSPEEGSQNHINYFLLSLSSPLVLDASVQFRTLDGTALAGIDYIYTSGQAVIEAGELHTVIGVEIIADTIAEDDETFFLEVFNPSGARFPGEEIILTAIRTIIDDDFM